MTQLETIDADHAIGTSESLLMCLWRGTTTRSAVSKLRTVGLGLADRRAPISMLTVVEAQAQMPDSVVRGDLADLFSALAGRVSCSALVFEGEGFRAATVRGITTGISLLARQPFPHKVFGSVEAAAQWMSGYDAAKLSVAGVTKNLGDLRVSLDGQSAGAT